MLENIDEKTIVCAAQHIKAFFRQSANKEPANWGKACVGCKHSDTCKFDWLARMQPLFEKADITIQLCQRGHPNK